MGTCVPHRRVADVALAARVVRTETGHVSDEISALIVPMPDADPVVDRYRRVLDSGAVLGVPAHVTVLYPFMPVVLIEPDVDADLRHIFGGVKEFECSLDTIDWFDRSVMYLRPQPDAPFRQMTKLVVDRWPQWPPYGGALIDPTPHVTIADNGDEAAMRSAATTIAQELPLDVVVSEVRLYAGTDQKGSWHHVQTFPLRPRSARPVDAP